MTEVIENITEVLHSDRETAILRNKLVYLKEAKMTTEKEVEDLIEEYGGDPDTFSIKGMAQEIVKKVRDSDPVCKELYGVAKEMLDYFKERDIPRPYTWTEAIAHYEGRE